METTSESKWLVNLLRLLVPLTALLWATNLNDYKGDTSIFLIIPGILIAGAITIFATFDKGSREYRHSILLSQWTTLKGTMHSATDKIDSLFNKNEENKIKDIVPILADELSKFSGAPQRLDIENPVKCVIFLSFVACIAALLAGGFQGMIKSNNTNVNITDQSSNNLQQVQKEPPKIFGLSFLTLSVL